MGKVCTRMFGLLAALAGLWPGLGHAAAGPAAPLIVVADTRHLTGWQAWFANLYNESHFYFTVLTVVAIPVVGLILGLLADLVMRTIGIDLKSRDLAEH